MTYFIF